MRSRSLLSLLIPCLATVACAQVVPVSYDFNSYSNDSGTDFWEDANGWSTSESGGAFFVSTTDSHDGSNYIRFENSGGGVGATASISDTFGAVRTDERFSLSFSYLDHNYWGTAVGLRDGSGTGGISLTASLYHNEGETPTGYVALAMGSLQVGRVGFDYSDASSWFDFRVDIDVGANGGSGSASVFSRTTGSASWSPVTGMTNLDLGLDATRTDSGSANPENWNTLWFHHEGATSGIDNLSITPIPEPSAYAAIFGAAVLGLACARRRSVRTGEPTSAQKG